MANQELLPPEVAAEVEQARARGFSFWGQETIARMRMATSEQEKEELAQEVREEVRAKFAQMAESHEALFERLIVMEKGKLYEVLGHESMRDFLVKGIGPQVERHRVTLFLMAGALEERRRLKADFGNAPMDWTILGRIAAESKRQEQNKGKVPSEEFRKLRRRVALEGVNRPEVLRGLRSPKGLPGDPPEPGGSDPAPREMGSGRVAPEQLPAAVGSGGVAPGQLHADRVDEKLAKLIESVTNRSPAAPAPEQLPRVIQRVLRDGADLERKLHGLDQTTPEDLEHYVSEDDLTECCRVLERLRDCVSRWLEKIESVSGTELIRASAWSTVEGPEDAERAISGEGSAGAEVPEGDFDDPFESAA